MRVLFRSLLRAQAVDRHDPFIDGAAERGLEQALLVPVPGIDGTLGHAGAGAHRIDAGAGTSFLEKQVERLVQQFLVAERRTARPPPARQLGRRSWWERGCPYGNNSG